MAELWRSTATAWSRTWDTPNLCRRQFRTALPR